MTQAGRRTACPICASAAPRLAVVHGSYSDRDYTLRRCPRCRLGFLEDPWEDYARIYDAAYYAGAGADPLVDYHYELAHPRRTLRAYEWRGIGRAVQALAGPLEGKRWLDFGAGNGGLVRHLRETSRIDAAGFEEGSIAADAAALGIPFVDATELDTQAGTFDVVTAIEVLEHVLDPVAELRRMRRLLRPGGLLFATTGNAAPHAAKLAEWPYVIPEIHVSFFEPGTLARAMELSGLRPQTLGRTPGVDDIIKFKVLKNLRLRRRWRATDALPAWPIARLGDRVARVSDMPIGFAVDPPPS